ncbi:hypothetical protein [Polyangium aurulentum]|uniref:hypothetical protein n=1 Tax=Polyangium aurulentum TaxID=2567896 RepID=UPI0010AE109D|nr:hypothetical protein [Polyangium aurulentum]UQA59083.1 hypothetical protein E8A73_000775 [Polyangium aurulentum]
MRTRRAWMLPFAIAGLFSAFWAGCGQADNKCDPSAATSNGAGAGGGTGGAGAAGGGGSSSSGGMAGAGGAPASCVAGADCGESTVCGVRTCEKGTCGMVALLKAGTVLDSQLPGDCSRAECDENGSVKLVTDDSDKSDDGNPCTVDFCQSGGLVHGPQNAGVACGINNAGKCDGKSQCTRCTIGGNDCSAGTTCVASRNYKDVNTLDAAINKCVPSSCLNGVKDNSESDVDCGGTQCAPCDTGKTCLSNLDCMDASCDGMPGSKTCAAPTCFDGSLNGNETYTDFGGPDCPPAPNSGWSCKEPADCGSGVCKDAKCLDPSCFDGVKNGDEAGIDCGGGCAALCLP